MEHKYVGVLSVQERNELARCQPYQGGVYHSTRFGTRLNYIHSNSDNKGNIIRRRKETHR
jgi:hypothetical protein